MNSRCQYWIGGFHFQVHTRRGASLWGWTKKPHLLSSGSPQPNKENNKWGAQVCIITSLMRKGELCSTPSVRPA